MNLKIRLGCAEIAFRQQLEQSIQKFTMRTIIFCLILVGVASYTSSSNLPSVETEERVTICDTLPEYLYLNRLVESSAKLDSVLSIIDATYLPQLIKAEHSCRDFFDDFSIKVLLPLHKQEMAQGHTAGALISEKAYDYLCLLLFQANYMKQSDNFSSSSRTEEVFRWTLVNLDQLSADNRQLALAMKDDS